MNRAQTNGERAVQVGGTNIIKNYDPEGTVVQIGLYNRCGEQSGVGVNIRRKREPKISQFNS